MEYNQISLDIINRKKPFGFFRDVHSRVNHKRKNPIAWGTVYSVLTTYRKSNRNSSGVSVDKAAIFKVALQLMELKGIDLRT